MYVPARSFCVSLLLVVLASVPGRAQDHSVSIGYGGGGIWFSSFNEASGRDLALDQGWVTTGHMDWWPGSGRVGGRAGVSFTRRPLQTSGDALNIHTWLFNGDVVLRLLPAGEPRSFVPFLSAGAGVVSYGLGEGDPVDLPAENAVYPGDTDRRFAAVGGAGFDVLPSRMSWLGTPIGFRVEATDHVVINSPFQPAAGGEYGPVHNVRVSVSVLGVVHLLR